MERLFVAVWPPASVVDALAGLVLVGALRRVRAEQLHVTLRFLGAADPDAVAGALDGVVLPATVGRIGGATRLLGRDAVVVPVAGLEALAGAVGRATGHLGAPVRERFVGHLTVGRLRGRARPATVVVPERSFAVDGIELVRSVLGGDGPTYTTLRTWPVGGT